MVQTSTDASIVEPTVDICDGAKTPHMQPALSNGGPKPYCQILDPDGRDI